MKRINEPADQLSESEVLLGSNVTLCFKHRGISALHGKQTYRSLVLCITLPPKRAQGKCCWGYVMGSHMSCPNLWSGTGGRLLLELLQLSPCWLQTLLCLQLIDGTPTTS